LVTPHRRVANFCLNIIVNSSVRPILGVIYTVVAQKDEVKLDRPYEAKTQLIAQELIKSTRAKNNILNRIREQMRWDDKVLDWTMANPGLRVQMFRFIDAIPALQSKTEIANHFQQYMSTEAVELPNALKSLLNFSDPDSFPAIDLLGEAVITEAEAADYLQRYLDLIEQLSQKAQSLPRQEGIDLADGEELSQVQVSVKLTAFYSQFDPLDPVGSKEKVCDRIRILLRKAAEVGAAIHFDMEQYRYKDLTLQILKELLLEEEFRTRTDLGITLQGYLRDSYQDLEDLIEWAKERGNPLTVRLVKGAYWDQETILAEQNHWSQPVYNQKEATDINYERMTQLLLENHEYLYGAIGSHNVRSQALACAIAQTLEIPPRHWEMQVLYGMGDKLAEALVKRGHRVRVYAPYGKLLPGMAYLIRRLLENTANSSFIRQNQEEKPIVELIAPPVVDNPQEQHVAKDGSFHNAADTDYADAEKRNQGSQALAKVKQDLGKTYLPLINGEYIATTNYLDSLNPSRSTELVGKVGQISVEQAEQAMDAAKSAFSSWKNTSAGERANIIRQAADIMEQRRHELNAWICLEVGKILPQADGEVSEAIDFCRFYADEMETEILVEAGIPQGVLSYVPGKGSQVGTYLVEHKDTHVIAFTGSREVGCKIYADAAKLQPGQKHLKRVIAEMGGKNAIIVDESADLDQAVAGIVQSAFGYSGQKCSACSRVIVAATVHDALLTRLIEATKSLNIGATDDPRIQVGPVIDASARERILEYIAQGKQESELVLSMTIPDGGYYVQKKSLVQCWR